MFIHTVHVEATPAQLLMHRLYFNYQNPKKLTIDYIGQKCGCMCTGLEEMYVAFVYLQFKCVSCTQMKLHFGNGLLLMYV